MNGLKKTFAAMTLSTLATMGTAYAEDPETSAPVNQEVNLSLCANSVDDIKNGSKGVIDVIKIFARLAGEEPSFETYSVNKDIYTFIKVKSPNESDHHLLVSEKEDLACVVTAESYNRFKPPAP